MTSTTRTAALALLAALACVGAAGSDARAQSRPAGDSSAAPSKAGRPLTIAPSAGAATDGRAKDAKPKPASAGGKPTPQKPAPQKSDTASKTAAAAKPHKPNKPNETATPRPAAKASVAPGRSTPTAQRSAAAVPLPRPRPDATSPVLAYADPNPGGADRAALHLASVPAVPPVSARDATPFLAGPTSSLSAADLGTVKRAVAFARKGDLREAADLQQAVADPVGRKLIEWALLRSDDGSVPLERYVAFIAANPSWPHVDLLRKRAEAKLWDDRHDVATIRAFFATRKPSTSKGRLALARALLAQGDRNGAAHYVRETWRRDALSRDLEAKALDAFGALLTPADHRMRMNWRLYDGDDDAALRAAQRLGQTELAIARARIAVDDKAANAGALLDAVPAEGRRDPLYILSRVQWLRRQDKVIEAAQLIQTAPRDPHALCDLDEWWIERRVLARKLLDLDEPKAAYVIARDAVPPSKENYRGEHQFTAGWIALRFLNDPVTALAHFARIADGTAHHMTLGRAGYWQGRALEAMGRDAEARAHYQAAARYSTAYYGQLARARLGLRDLPLHPPLELTPERRAALAKLEIVRAVEILYAIDQRDLVASMLADLGARAVDSNVLMMLGEIAKRHGDPRGMLLVGKNALARGLPLGHYAFPTVGLPKYRPIGPEVEPALVYSIARQESAFNPTVISPAKAMGLMQVTPAAGRSIAKRYGTTFTEKRLLSDPSYNLQFGAAELGGLLQDYRGSYILTFVGYNAGRGRVKEWIARYGDPRDPRVDPVDWVERIPFSETRNYVQRIMENLQIYRARFGGERRLLIEADLRRGRAVN